MWRLLDTPARGADWNMACDQALAESVARGESPPVLRFYGWAPPALSIGYAQPIRHLRRSIEELRGRGFGAVRRPTGGRAVFHAAEVTYSVVVPRDLPALSGRLRDTCARIHSAILAGLESLGIAGLALHGVGGRQLARAITGSHATRERWNAAGWSPRGDRPEPVCFAAASRSEIACDGRKLVGSAQLRLSNAVLQHGSILLDGDQSELAWIWPGLSTQRSVANLRDASCRSVGSADVTGAIRRGFERELAAAFEESVLRPLERERAAELVAERYGREDFLYRL